jgi:hypothetical protein
VTRKRPQTLKLPSSVIYFCWNRVLNVCSQRTAQPRREKQDGGKPAAVKVKVTQPNTYLARETVSSGDNHVTSVTLCGVPGLLWGPQGHRGWFLGHTGP